MSVTVAAGSGARFVGADGAGGPGGTVTTRLDPATYGQTLHVLAGAAGIENPSFTPPYAQGGGGSYVAAPGAFVAIAGGGGGGGVQGSHSEQNGMPLPVPTPIVNLTGGAGGFATASADGGRGTDSNNADSYGTGATGSTPGTGNWSPTAAIPGGTGTSAAVAADGTITAGTGGEFTYIGQPAGDGGGGYAGGGSGAFASQYVTGPNNTTTNTVTAGAGGGGSGFLAAGLDALTTAPNTGDGYVTFTYSIAAAVPGAPTALTATPDPDSGAAIISWTDPADTGGSAILGYPLERSTDGTNWSAIGSLAVGIANGTYLDYGLQAGVTYHYRLAAENSAGVGPFSAPASMLSQTYPGSVLNLTASAGDASAVIAWAAPADTGGTPITAYEVQSVALTSSDSSPSAVPDARWVGASTTATSPFTITGLSNDIAYGFRVRAVNAQGTSRDWQYAQANPQALPVAFSPVIAQPDGTALDGSTVMPGSTIVVSQSGLRGGAAMTVVLSGRTTANMVFAVLGTAFAGSDGTIQMTLTLPAELEPGDYAVTAELSDAGSTALPYTVTFTVQDASAPSGEPTGAGPASAESPVVPAANAGGTLDQADSLVSTGAAVGPWTVLVASLLVLSGITLMIMKRRWARA